MEKSAIEVGHFGGLGAGPAALEDFAIIFSKIT